MLNTTEWPFEKAFPREQRGQFLSRIGRKIRWSPAMKSISEFSVYQRAFFSMLGKNVAQFHKLLCVNPKITFSELVKALPGPAGIIPDSIWAEFLLRAEWLVEKAHLIQAMDERHPDKKELFQFLVEQRLSIPGSFHFVQHGPAWVFYVGREYTFRSLEEQIFRERTSAKAEVMCRWYVLDSTWMGKLSHCIIVLRADAKAEDVEQGLMHETKHVYFAALFPERSKLSYLDRAKDEIIAYLEEYRDKFQSLQELSDAVFQAITGYFDEILEGKIFHNRDEESDFMDIFCEELKGMIYVWAQISQQDPNFWVTLMVLPAKQWTRVLPRVYDIVI
jgi:hypothetical protein